MVVWGTIPSSPSSLTNNANKCPTTTPSPMPNNTSATTPISLVGMIVLLLLISVASTPIPRSGGEPPVPWRHVRNGCAPYPSPEHILERASPNLPFDETFDDFCMRDLVWAHAVSADRRLDHVDFSGIPSFISLLQRGLRDWEPHEGRNTNIEELMRYASCIRVMSLSYCNKLGKKVPFLFASV